MSNDKILIKEMLDRIQKLSGEAINIMEVCGTHTQAISKFGIRQLVEPNIKLLSGPGCPVCVTSEEYIDAAIELTKYSNIIIATFGDMMKVLGSRENLIKQRERGREIRVVYSPLEAIRLAEDNRSKEVVFLGIGFETTAPLIALIIKSAKEKNIKNLSVLTGMKRMEPILHYILSKENHNIHGLICPGHVAAVKGEKYFEFTTENYNIPAAIAGFEAADIVSALYFLTVQQGEHKKSFKNLYKKCVTKDGNIKANSLMEEVFTYCPAKWRGIGSIKSSGLTLKDNYKEYNAALKYGVKIKEESDTRNICSEVLLGRKLPTSCEYFGRLCNPEKPMGPSMVSAEGSCAVFYRYKGVK